MKKSTVFEHDRLIIALDTNKSVYILDDSLKVHQIEDGKIKSTFDYSKHRLDDLK